MKTSLVIKARDKFERAATPEDGAEEQMVPHYMPAHRAQGTRWRNGKAQHEWNEKEAVHTRYYIFHPKRGKLDAIRYLRPDVVESLSKMDTERDRLREEIRKLNREEQELLAMTFDRGRMLTVEETKAWREQRLAAKS